MSTFKQFLLETAVKQPPKYTRIQVESAIKLLKSKCKKNLWMVTENKPLWRGDDYKGFTRLPNAANAYSVDSSATKRRSSNTWNFYTEIFDSHPKMTAYPKRSRSLIATTNKAVAVDYSSGGFVFVIIPFDTAKVGIVGRADIWGAGKNVEMFNRRFLELREVNDIFRMLLKSVGINSTGIKGLEKFASMLQNPKSKARDVLSDIIKLQKTSSYGALIDSSISEEEVQQMVEEIADDFMGYVYANLSPQNLGFSNGVENIKRYKNSEVWVGGELLIFDEAAWKEVKKHFGAK